MSDTIIIANTEGESESIASFKIPRFHGKHDEDYSLRRMRLGAFCRNKGVWNAVEPNSDSQSESTKTVPMKSGLSTKLEKASRLIITSLGDVPRRVVLEDNDNPACM